MRTEILLGLMLIICLTSCEKVIDISLKETEKLYVIEGTLTDKEGDCVVSLSKTKNFNEDNSFAGIAGAEVSVKDNEGNTTMLLESSTGVYRSETLTAGIGKKYTLHVNIDGNTFSASCALPAKVNMDSFYIKEEIFFGETIKLANVEYLDPLGKGNNYRFVQYVNGKKESSIFIRDDDYSDGNISTITLFTVPEEEEDEINSGDNVTVEMQCITPAVYKYWFSLDQGASGGNNSASPANPVSNIEGGALGYFSVHTVESKTIVAR